MNRTWVSPPQERQLAAWSLYPDVAPVEED
jgi:hypothetical protein